MADELVQQMREKAEAVQTTVVELRGLGDALRYAVELTRNRGGKTMAAPGLCEADASALAALCEKAGVVLLRHNLRDHPEGIHTGFSLAEWGIAETGTLVQDSTSEDLRRATMLSEIHVAALPRQHIRPDAMALEGELSRLLQAPPRYLAFISGASRTADIERVLTIGVHGPRELHILILEEEPS